MKLPRTHLTVLEALEAAADALRIDELTERTALKPETVTGAAFSLEEDGYLRIDEEKSRRVTLTEEGQTYAHEGLPEVALHGAAVELAGVGEPLGLGTVLEHAGLPQAAADIAISNFARKEYGRIKDGQLVVDRFTIDDSEATALEALLEENSAEAVDPAVLERLERRNLVEMNDRTVRRVELTAAGRELLEEGVDVSRTEAALTPELLTSGEWRSTDFRPYNVEADPPIEYGGSEHVLRRLAERVKDELVGMGFREMAGPHVDADFWINDCLFMPQDHPARTHWDRFELAEPTTAEELPADLVERVERVHREGVGTDGAGYQSPWEESVARALALRGHTTSLSARYLAGVAEGDLEPPQRFFSVEKAYRNDTLDATHLLEFFQVEGWVMAESLSVRDLMGTFTELYASFGITDLEFKPHYNPYTEPSFELFGTHPESGEMIEIGNSGIFRPEMLEPLGVEGDVMAWGLALERLMMLVTGAEDIRDVHGTLVDLDFLRTERVVY